MDISAVSSSPLTTTKRQTFCKTNHLQPSMSRRGNCWDNAVAESFKKRIYKDRDAPPGTSPITSNRFTIAHAATVILAA